MNSVLKMIVFFVYIVTFTLSQSSFVILQWEIRAISYLLPITFISMVCLNQKMKSFNCFNNKSTKKDKSSFKKNFQNIFDK